MFPDVGHAQDPPALQPNAFVSIDLRSLDYMSKTFRRRWIKNVTSLATFSNTLHRTPFRPFLVHFFAPNQLGAAYHRVTDELVNRYLHRLAW